MLQQNFLKERQLSLHACRQKFFADTCLISVSIFFHCFTADEAYFLIQNYPTQICLYYGINNRVGFVREGTCSYDNLKSYWIWTNNGRLLNSAMENSDVSWRHNIFTGLYHKAGGVMVPLKMFAPKVSWSSILKKLIQEPHILLMIRNWMFRYNFNLIIASTDWQIFIAFLNNLALI